MKPKKTIMRIIINKIISQFSSYAFALLFIMFLGQSNSFAQSNDNKLDCDTTSIEISKSMGPFSISFRIPANVNIDNTKIIQKREGQAEPYEEGVDYYWALGGNTILTLHMGLMESFSNFYDD